MKGRKCNHPKKAGLSGHFYDSYAKAATAPVRATRGIKPGGCLVLRRTAGAQNATKPIPEG